jgi:hypothetical protein
MGMPIATLSVEEEESPMPYRSQDENEYLRDTEEDVLEEACLIQEEEDVKPAPPVVPLPATHQ